VFFDAAVRKVAGWSAISLRLGERAGGPITASIEEPGTRLRSQLSFEAATGAVQKWTPASAQSRGAQWRALVVPLHTGRIAGVPGQIVALLSAAGTTGLVWTGLALAWRRLRGWRARNAVRRPEFFFLKEES
jgi:uncharacterized iron-regulated membrane protein